MSPRAKQGRPRAPTDVLFTVTVGDLMNAADYHNLTTDGRPVDYRKLIEPVRAGLKDALGDIIADFIDRGPD